MSKKTRKKSPKKAPAKVARAKPAIPAKTPPSKARRTTANKSGKIANKPSADARQKTSHKAPSKQLKPAPATASKRPPAANATAGTPPKPSIPAAKKPAPVKSDAPAVRGSGLTEGAKAPAFRLPRDGGSTVSLSDFKGTKLVLFFYPRADTPGCTKEAIEFTRLADAFSKSRTALLGVSADPLKAQEAFREKHQLVTPLASDEPHTMLEAYGVWGEKSMYGRTFQGILRTTVLIGGDGRIIRIWRNVKVDGHADEVLAAARAE